jgi:hypothetical protein
VEIDCDRVNFWYLTRLDREQGKGLKANSSPHLPTFFPSQLPTPNSQLFILLDRQGIIYVNSGLTSALALAAIQNYY